MKLTVNSPKGEAPRVSPRLLGENMAQEATNCRLQSGDIEPFRQFVSEKVLASAAQTIYKLNGSWLSWNAQVDAARGLIPGDTAFFLFLTSPGLYSTPRYTTYALATTGAEPFPVTTLPLGMPAPTIAPTLVAGVDPTPTSFSVDITDVGDDLTQWTTSGIHPGFDFGSIVQQDLTSVVQPSYQVYIENNAGLPAYAYRNFGTAGAATSQISVDFAIDPAQGDDGIVVEIGYGVAATGLGAYVTISSDINAPVLLIYTGTTWAAKSELGRVAVGVPFVRGTVYTLTATKLKNADGSVTVTAKVYDGVTLLQSLIQTNTFEDGEFMALVGVTGDDPKSTFYKNIHVTASGATGLVNVNTATSYVYTFVGANDWESAPSPASATILRPDGVAVTVTTETTHGYDVLYGIDTKRIYRSVSGATGDIFLLVAEIPLLTPTFLDNLDDSVISTPGTPLESEYWDLPPANMQGIISLPNNCMAGFFANQLCFSAVGRVHAWPVRYRLTTDTDIVAIANIDNTIVIGTKSRVQTATGNDPSTYSMSQPGEAQACVSKRSMVYLDGYGVVFASPDGYQVCAGSAGNVKNATELIFTKTQWEALVPSSTIAAVYDGVLYFWVTGPTPDSGYAIDTRASGAGLIRLSHHVAAVHVDPLTDSMFMILDANNEPTDVDLPVASTAVTPTSTTIFQWDASPTEKIVYRWTGKLNILPYSTVLHFAKCEAEDFTNLLSRVYAGSSLLHEKVATSNDPYRIPGLTTYATYWSEVMGTSRVRTHQIASTVVELD